jgi:hypothetical protein
LRTIHSIAETIRQEAPVSYYYGKWTTRCWRAMRELRIGIYTQQFDIIDDATEFISLQCKEIVTSAPPTVQISTTPFDPSWFRNLPVSFQFYLFNNVLGYAQSNLISYPDLFSFLQDEEEFKELTEDERLPFKRLIFN